jgi:hypothetical protein
VRYLMTLVILTLSAPVQAAGAAVFHRDSPGTPTPKRPLAHDENGSLVELVKGSLSIAGVSPCAVEQTIALPSLPKLAPVLTANGCSRLFVVHGLRLGRKRVIQLSELKTSTPHSVIFSARMSAQKIEELDVVVPRLVRAVLAKKTPRSTAEVDQVTRRESREWRKKDGELLVGGAIPIGSSFHQDAQPSYGLGGLVSYEMEHARLDAALVGQFNSRGDELWHGGLTLGAAYLFSATNTSPYLGANIGYGATWMGSDVDDADFGLLVSVGGGVEFFRLYKARMLLDARLTLPTYQLGGALQPIMTGMLGVMLVLN